MFTFTDCSATAWACAAIPRSAGATSRLLAQTTINEFDSRLLARSFAEMIFGRCSYRKAVAIQVTRHI